MTYYLDSYIAVKEEMVHILSVLPLYLKWVIRYTNNIITDRKKYSRLNNGLLILTSSFKIRLHMQNTDLKVLYMKFLKARSNLIANNE